MPYVIFFVLAIVLIGGYFALLATLLSSLVVFIGLPLLAFAAVGAYAYGAVAPLVLLVAPKWETAREQRLATPLAVTSGTVLGKQPSGEMAAHGWDSAWPNYFPYQASRDFRLVVDVLRRFCLNVFMMPWRWCRSMWRGKGLLARLFFWFPVVVSTVLVVGLPMMLFAILAMVSVALFVVLLWVAMMAATGIARLFGYFYGLRERVSRKRAGKELACPSCYRTTLFPGYQCPGCGRTHRLLQPGPLGIINRVCECGASLPTTASRAAARQLEVVCPYCDITLGTTAGSRPTLLVPVMGSVGVGKTSFLAAAVTGMARATASAGSFAPINPAADQFTQLAHTGMTLPKTAYAGRPDVLVFEASMGGPVHDIQLVDAAGEFFVNWESAQQLSYIDTAPAWVLVIDPLMLPEVRDRLDAAGVGIDESVIGTGAPSDAYASVVDRFTAGGGKLTKKSLAVVVSKADILAQVPEWAELGSSARAVRQLLMDNGADNLIRGAELDFTAIDYFAIEAAPASQPTLVRDPLRVIDWALARKGLRLSFLDLIPAEPELAATAAATSDTTASPAPITQ